MKLAMRTLVATVVMAAGLAAVPAVSNASTVGDTQGCTPGYWKNHTDSWKQAKPSTTYGSLFTSARANVKGLTLDKALAGGGGSGLDGAALILARASTAAWLNAAYPGLEYPWRREFTGVDGRPPLVAAVNAAFASNNRDTMLALATQLDNDNNLGCPLS